MAAPLEDGGAGIYNTGEARLHEYTPTDDATLGGGQADVARGLGGHPGTGFLLRHAAVPHHPLDPHFRRGVNHQGRLMRRMSRAAFAAFVNNGIAYPALGNLELDSATYQAELDALAARGVDMEGVQIKKDEKSFFWSGKYHMDMNTRDTLETQLNVLADFDPKVPDSYQDCEVKNLVLGRI
mgnify:CR=1 FL=1